MNSDYQSTKARLHATLDRVRETINREIVDQAFEANPARVRSLAKGIQRAVVGSHEWDKAHPWQIEVETERYGWQCMDNGHATRSGAVKKYARMFGGSNRKDHKVRIIRRLYDE